MRLNEQNTHTPTSTSNAIKSTIFCHQNAVFALHICIFFVLSTKNTKIQSVGFVGGKNRFHFVLFWLSRTVVFFVLIWLVLLLLLLLLSLCFALSLYVCECPCTWTFFIHAKHMNVFDELWGGFPLIRIALCILITINAAMECVYKWIMTLSSKNCTLIEYICFATRVKRQWVCVFAHMHC